MRSNRILVIFPQIKGINKKNLTIVLEAILEKVLRVAAAIFFNIKNALTFDSFFSFISFKALSSNKPLKFGIIIFFKKKCICHAAR